jgi:DNA-binding CsgD family transcriptional regulator
LLVVDRGGDRIPPRERRGGSVRIASLTAREREVLALLASGLRDRQIANQLGVSENTVKTHARHLLAKLGASSRAHAVAIGFTLKLLQPIEIVHPEPR